MSRERACGHARTMFASFVAVWLSAHCLAQPADDECPDNLSLDRDPSLSRSARRNFDEGTRLHEAAMTSSDWDKMIVAARKALRSAARTSKDCALPQYHLGNSYFTTRLFEDSEEWFEEAVERAPEFYEAHAALARVKLVLTRFDEALAASEAALEACASYRPAIEAKAASLIRLERLAEARSFLDGIPLPRAQAEATGATAESATAAGTTEGAPAGDDGNATAKPEAPDTIAVLRNKLSLALDGPPWSTTHVSESENYRVLTPVSQEFADQISRRAELIHEVYRDAFPNIKRPERKYDVLVYSDATEYLAAGSPANTGGYYDSLFRRLVMFRDELNPQFVFQIKA